MIQLTFQPALDPFHAVFRFFRLRDWMNVNEKMPYDKLRIIDFYAAFPFRIGEIRLIPAHRKYKKLAGLYEKMKPYGDLPDSHVLFDRMEPMQEAAAQSMAAKGYYSVDEFKNGAIVSTDKATPPEIAQRAAVINEEQCDLMNFLQLLAQDYSVGGHDGLKARSGLIEYRYDAI